MTTRSTPSGLHPAAADSLDERSRRVLSAIVRDYIADGQPVGSHAVARRPDVDVSSATVRAVMADLEEMGYLEKPHTSSGRIPTSRGYRYYVDALLRVKPPLPEERERIERRAHEGAQEGIDALMANASRVLHSLTRHAGVIAAPRPQSERLSRIEFLQLREGRALAVLVSRSGAVHIEGQSSLLEEKALGQDLDKIRALFRALEEKQQLLHVLDRTLEAEELRIFIGAESGIVEPDLAIVAAPYRLKGEVVGALGVIGPTRMDYSRVVPLVELTARTVGLTLEEP